MPVYVCISFVTYEHPLYRFIVLHRGRFVYCPFLLVRFSVSRHGDLLLVCTLGGFEQLRRRPPPAAETGSRSRGSGRRGGGPLKGRTPMRKPQPARRRRSAGTNSPVDCWLARGRVPGGMWRSAGPDGGGLTESVGLLFCCYSPGCRVGASSGTRTAAKATAACGGNREPEQGQRSQRWRPVPRGADRCGHRNP